MGISPQFGSGVIAAQVMTFQERLEKLTLFMLQYLGESLVKYARESHNYIDRTGNLTNSIGYAVVRNRKIVASDVTTQPGISAENALKVALKMANESSSAYSLIIVAGMEYAAYVEAKGYNVILPAELKARTDFPATMQKLIAKAENKAKDMFGMI